MPPFDRLIKSIDARIEELKSDIASLQAARSALVANAASATPPPPVKATPTTRRRRRKTTKPLTAEGAEQLLATSDGLTTAALAQRAGAGRDQVLALLRDLETARRVRRTGQLRATRWHAITSEDMVRERAEELASRSGGRRARA